MASRPLIAHVLHRFDTGGLENGVVNLINRLPEGKFRHAVVALTEVGAFSRRIERDDVQLVAMHKSPGQGLWLAPRMRRLLRQLGPAIVHTRNIGALEMSLPAAWAGVPVRIHSEHGWDVADPDGNSRKHRWIRRAFKPFVHQQVALSRQIRDYLVERVGVAEPKVQQIYNGVDTRRFSPGPRKPIAGSPFTDPTLRIVGTVGRLQAIKDQVTLARAFVRACQSSPLAQRHLRLAIAGEGPLRSEIRQVLIDGGVDAQAWLAGDRDDVPDFLRGLDEFVLPSRAEGISNTILESMATGLPIIATDVGGNGELLCDPSTGRLVPAGAPDIMAEALIEDLQQPERARQRGLTARAEVERRFSLDAMVEAYTQLYERMLEAARKRGAWQQH